MAFQLFRPSVAANYASSFRPWTANGGYANVKSDMAKKYLSAIPAANFKAEMDMASRGLDNWAGMAKQRMVNEAALELQEAQNEAEIEANKKKALLGMLTRSGNAGVGIGADNTQSLLKMLSNGSTSTLLDMTNGNLGTIRNIQAYGQQSEGPYVGAMEQVVKSVGKAATPQARTPLPTLPKVEIPELEAAPPPSTRLDAEGYDRLDSLIQQSLGLTTSSPTE